MRMLDVRSTTKFQQLNFKNPVQSHAQMEEFGEEMQKHVISPQEPFSVWTHEWDGINSEPCCSQSVCKYQAQTNEGPMKQTSGK